MVGCWSDCGKWTCGCSDLKQQLLLKFKLENRANVAIFQKDTENLDAMQYPQLISVGK